jgi:hypothetical protein
LFSLTSFKEMTELAFKFGHGVFVNSFPVPESAYSPVLHHLKHWNRRAANHKYVTSLCNRSNTRGNVKPTVDTVVIAAGCRTPRGKTRCYIRMKTDRHKMGEYGLFLVRFIHYKHAKTNSVAFSPQANYTD